MFKRLLSAFFIRVRNPDSMYNQVSYLFLANLITILSQFLFAPILTRYYSPESYGTFSAFFAAGINVSSLLTLRYEQSIMIEESKENRDTIAGILVTCSLIFTCILSIVMFLNIDFFSAIIGVNSSSYWILLFPLFVFLTVFFTVTGVEITIAKKFKHAFVYGSPILIFSKLINITYGFLCSGHFSGLVFGDVFLRLGFVLFRLSISLKKTIRQYLIFSKSQFSKAFQLFKKYKRFPLFEMPALYVGLLVSQSTTYFLIGLNENALLGWVGISTSLLDAPLRLISYSISPVVMQRAVEMKNNMPAFRRLLERIISNMYVITLIPSVLLYIWGQDIFKFVFGSEWAMSGLIASSFIFFYIFRFEYDVIDNVLTVLGFQKRKLLISLIEGLIRVGLLISTYLIIKDAFKTIIIWAYQCAIVYFFVTLYSYRVLKLKLNRLTLVKILITILFTGALFFRYYV